jgi:hypothetical protein
MHHFLAMVDEHSRGKVITIRRRKAGAVHATGGAKKKKRDDSEDELAAAEGNEEAASNDELDPEGNEYGDEDEEEEDEVGYENKQFNFNQELSILVDYQIISLMIQLLSHEQYSKSGDVL